MLAESSVADLVPVPVEIKACQRAQIWLLSPMSGESVGRALTLTRASL